MDEAIGLATEYEALQGSVDRVKKPHAGSEQRAPDKDSQQSITLDYIDRELDKKLNHLSTEVKSRDRSPIPARRSASPKLTTEHKETYSSGSKSESL